MATKKKMNGQPTLTATPKKQPKSQEKKTKDGIRKPQVRVLQALAKSKQPLNRAEISEKGDVDLAMLNSYIGAKDAKVRAKNDKKVMLSLLTLKYVTATEKDGSTVYTITASGKKALQAATKGGK